MSIEEHEAARKVTAGPSSARPDQGLSDRTRAAREAERELARPFGGIKWPLAIPALLVSIGIILTYGRIIPLGTYEVNYRIRFDVEWTLFVLTLIAGIATIAPRLWRKPGGWRSQNTLVSAVVTILFAIFFASHVADLGTFDYTQKYLDGASLVAIALALIALVLAFLGSRIAVVGLAILVVWWGASLEGFGLTTFTDLFTSEDGSRLLRNLTPPNWKDFGAALDPLFVTIKVAIVSTLLGVIGALPLSILAARNTTPHPLLYGVTRSVTNILRSIPAFFMALLFIPFYGLGVNAAILGLSVHSISVLTKIFAESIESVRPEPIEALSAVGANGLKRFRWGITPQALPLLASYSLFNFESNVRDSTVLAFVGGGGIGFLLYEDINLLQYHNVAVLLAMLIVAVILLDRVSDYLRSKII
jgi:phosphonate transport system permease protein